MCNYWKELWQKKKLLIIINFTFCHNVFKIHLFKPLVLPTFLKTTDKRHSISTNELTVYVEKQPVA